MGHAGSHQKIYQKKKKIVEINKDHPDENKQILFIQSLL